MIHEQFIHITKTGGTSIESIGMKEAGVAWGARNKKEYGWWHAYFPAKPVALKEAYDWFTVVRDPSVACTPKLFKSMRMHICITADPNVRLRRWFLPSVLSVYMFV